MNLDFVHVNYCTRYVGQKTERKNQCYTAGVKIQDCLCMIVHDHAMGKVKTQAIGRRGDTKDASWGDNTVK